MSYVITPAAQTASSVSTFYIRCNSFTAGSDPTPSVANTETQILLGGSNWTVETSNSLVTVETDGSLTVGETGQLWLFEWFVGLRGGTGATDDTLWFFLSDSWTPATPPDLPPAGTGNKSIVWGREQERTASGSNAITNYAGSAVIDGGTSVYASFYASLTTVQYYGNASEARSWFRATRLS